MFRKTVIQSTNVTINLLLTVLLIAFAGAIYTTQVDQVEEETICSVESGDIPCANDQGTSNDTLSENSTLVSSSASTDSIPVYEIIGTTGHEEMADQCSAVVISFSSYLINFIVAVVCVLIAIRLTLRLIRCKMTDCKVLRDQCLTVRA